MKSCLISDDDQSFFSLGGGGKASNLAKMSKMGFAVPSFICLTNLAQQCFWEANGIELFKEEGESLGAYAARVEATINAGKFPQSLRDEIDQTLKSAGLFDQYVAVRSSGLDEDSKDNSFAGQFSSFLNVKGAEGILDAIKRCWSSGYSERALAYRAMRRLPLHAIEMGVIVQEMVAAESAGVAFSRNPMHPLDRKNVIVSSVWGLGEGLVSGELEADEFLVSRDLEKIEATIADKRHTIARNESGGVQSRGLEDSKKTAPSISDAEVRLITKMALECEEKLGSAQDIEWAMAGGNLYLLQSRPVTTLPSEAFFDAAVNGKAPTLWDNSNIIESYCGVTTPLTFSFASSAYRQVYAQFCEMMGVPDDVIAANDIVFRNMLGLVRGRIYYNLVNWYRLLLMLPGASSNKSFMETMMGVKQGLSPEVASIFDFLKDPPKYSIGKRAKLGVMTLYRFARIDSIIGEFQADFKRTYDEVRGIDFRTLSLTEQAKWHQTLTESVLKRWQAPIINDYLCMIFFGLLKKLTAQWIEDADKASSLQNDLLCGQGDLESTEPTKMLMRIAAQIDKGDPATRAFFLDNSPSDAWKKMGQGGEAPEVGKLLLDFLDRYGFRCVNELKLEEPDLHDDPSFAIGAIAGYLRTGSYSIGSMEEREKQIRGTAEARVKDRISGPKRALFFWVLGQARKAVRNRENLRFDRTKIFGISRHLFRAMGGHLVALNVIEKESDIFYLTTDEILAYIEGRPTSTRLGALAKERRAEFDEYRRTPAPPDRFITYGAVGASMEYLSVLSDGDMLRSEKPSDPTLLYGVSCCPGIVEGVVRVVRDIKDAEGIHGEILVTERTDPGWVPIYPSCLGLLIERGSLLSHSAVVARELGLPTIVGVRGGLLERLKTGQRVRIDAGAGEIRILD